RSDTEVIVHGYEEWGDELPNRLRGMFAFGLWDGREKRLLLARDRLGIKPLYWTLTSGGDLVFASEIKALFAFPDVRRELCSSRLADYFALRYVPGPDTLFAGIQRLQPGHRLVFKDGALDQRQFWDVPVDAGREDGRPRDEIEEAEALTQELLESVRLRLMSEVPVGVFLSGGIDSTAVAWAMNQADPSALKSFAVGYEGDSEGELAWARMAAQDLGTEHRQVTVDSAAFRDSMEDLAWHLDEPLSDGACIPLMHLAKRAREEVVVVLSGEGADEVLAGYPIYSKMLALERMRAVGGRALDRLVGLAAKGPWPVKVNRYLRLAGKPLKSRYLGVGRAFDDASIAAHFGPRALDEIAERNAPRWSRTQGLDPLHRMLYLDTKVWLPDDLLLKADKMTMAWAIELRVPFLDHELLGFAWSLPSRLKLARGVGKRLLRTSMAGKIPSAILGRPKKGFPVPLTRWLRTDLYEPCRARLLALGSASRDIFGARALERMLEEHRRGEVDRREELFALWVFEEWHATYLGRGARERERARLAAPPRVKGLEHPASAAVTP
ncbi:MAG: asparagine synthase (glutamine-hydrolyzing), partial [Deltaproteobacteria bacterium]|nr:asparagine synthase (glutamine-hydrolyzing) [Deltaproteobacteria bacterium]